MIYEFSYFNPTRILFGKGVIRRLGEISAKYGRRVLIITGQGSVKRIGLYDQAVKLLKEKELEIFELSGVLPNPRLSKCEEGAQICKRENIDLVIGLGGGSVLDTAKTVAAAALDDGNLWDFFEKKRKIEKALPIVAIMTVAATGSEYNRITVIKNEKLHKKDAVWDEHLYPKVSLLDPELTYSVSPQITAYGGVDIISHALETYITGKYYPLLQLRFKEALITTVMESVKKAQQNPNDYEARSYLMWASSMACSQILNMGNGEGPIPAHIIDTEAGGLYDTPHGAGLAVLLPAVMKYEANKYAHSIVRFSREIMRINSQSSRSDINIAAEGIEAFRKWLKSIGCPITLRELGIKEEDLGIIAQRVSENPLGTDKATALGILNTYYG